MATTPLPPSEPDEAGPPPVAVPERDELDAFIEQRLRRTRRQVKGVELVSGLMALLVGGLVYLFLVALLDHWAISGGLGPWGRGLAALGLVLLAGGYFVLRIGPLLIYRINPIFAAQTIEQSRPGFKNSLINFLFLRRERSALEQDRLAQKVYRSLEEVTANELANPAVETAVDRSEIIRLGYALIAVVVLAALYAMLSPKNPLTSFARVLFPWAEVSAPTRVTIFDVKPGDQTAFQGEPVTVSAQVTGLNEGEAVTLYYSTADGLSVNQAIPMSASDKLRRQFQCDVPPGKAGLQQDLEYSLAAGDAHTRRYKIRSEVPLSIHVDQVQYEYPAYTGVPPRTMTSGDIRAVEGTKITVTATTSKPIHQAALEMNCDARNRIDMAAHETQATGHFTLRMAEKNAIRPEEPLRPQYSSYQLRFSDAAGRENTRPIRHEIEVIPDLSPDVRLIDPPPDKVEVPLNGAVEFKIRAEDPDYGLREVALRAERRKVSLRIEPLLELRPPKAAQAGVWEGTYRLQPAKLNLKPGEEIVYWAEAEDNREPTRNHVETERRTLKIVAARDNATQPPPQQPQDQKAQERKGQNQKQDPNQGDQPKNHPQDDPQENKSAKGARDKAGTQPSDTPEQPQNPNEKQTPPQPNRNQDPQNNDPNQPDNPDQRNGAEGQQKGPSQQAGDPEQKKSSQPVDGKTNPGGAFDQILKDLEQKKPQEANPSGEKSQAGDKSQSGEKSQAGDKGQSGEKSQAGDKSQSGDKSQAGDKSQSGEKSQAGDKGQSGEKSQAGDKSQSGDKSQAGDKGQSGEKSQAGDKSQSGDKSQAGDKSQSGEKSQAGDKGQSGEKSQAGDKSQSGEKSQAGDKGQSGEKSQAGDKGQSGEKSQAGDKSQSGDKSQAGDKSQSGEKSQAGDKGQSGEKSQAGDKSQSGEKSQAGDKGQSGEKSQAGDKSQSGDKSQAGDKGQSGEKSQAGDKSQSGEKSQAGDKGQSGEKSQAGDKSQSGEKSQAGDKGQSGEKSQAGDKSQSGEKSQAGDKSQSGEKSQAGDKSQSGEKSQAGDKGQSGEKSQAGDKSQPGEKSQAGDKSQSGDKSQAGDKAQAGEDARSEKPSSPDVSEGTREAQRKPAAGTPEGQAAPSQSRDNPPGSAADKPSPNDPRGTSGSQTPQGGSSSSQGPSPQGGTPSSKQQSSSGKGSSSSTGSAPSGTKSGEAGQPSGQSGGKSAEGGNGEKNASQGGKTSSSGDGQHAASEAASKGGDKGGDGGSEKGTESSANSKASASDSNASQGSSDSGQGQDNGAGGSSQGTQSGGAGNGTPGGGGPGNSTSGGSAETGPLGADEANLEYANKQTDLALDHLKHEMAKENSDLLKRMGWSKKDAEQFLQQWEQMKQRAAEPEDRSRDARKELKDALESLGLRRRGAELKGGKTSRDSQRQMHESIRIEPPPEWADQVQEYRKGLNQSEKAPKRP